MFNEDNRRLDSLRYIEMSQNQPAINHTAPADEAPKLARRLGPFDATMIVMGGIIGSGIFMNPHVVAGVVHTPALILGAWAVGGLIALAGAFIYAELAALRPQVGGQYTYIREESAGSLSVKKTLAQRAWRRSSVTSPSTQTVGRRPRYCATPLLKAATE